VQQLGFKGWEYNWSGSYVFHFHFSPSFSPFPCPFLHFLSPRSKQFSNSARALRKRCRVQKHLSPCNLPVATILVLFCHPKMSISTKKTVFTICRLIKFCCPGQLFSRLLLNLMLVVKACSATVMCCVLVILVCYHSFHREAASNPSIWGEL